MQQMGIGSAPSAPSADAGHSSASLAARIEELRVFLERQLGTDRFLRQVPKKAPVGWRLPMTRPIPARNRAYQRLESINPRESEDGALQDLNAILGAQDLQYLPYVFQLIACEQMLNFH